MESYNWNAIADKMMQPAKVYDGRNVIENSSRGEFNLIQTGR